MAAALIREAKNPMIMLGSGAIGAEAEVAELARLLQAPVTAHRSGKGVLPDDDPLALLPPAAWQYWQQCDLLIGIGSRLELQYFPGAKYQIKPTPESWSRPCIHCGCNEPRPKNLYRCDTCVDREGDAERVTLEQHQQTQARKKPYKPEVPW